MSSSALGHLARNHPVWVHAWGMLDGSFSGELDKVGLKDPLLWAGLRGDRDCLLLMLDSMGLTSGKNPENITRLLDQCVVLQAAARGVGEMWTEQHASLSDVQLSLEMATAKRAKQEEQTFRKVAKLAASAALIKPAF